ncbi:hypothetical protein, partial [Mycobacterium tuberculosis]
ADDISAILPDLLTTSFKAVCRGTVFLIIWSTALKRSERAQRTFVRPLHDGVLRPLPQPVTAVPEATEDQGGFS